MTDLEIIETLRKEFPRDLLSEKQFLHAKSLDRISAIKYIASLNANFTTKTGANYYDLWLR